MYIFNPVLNSSWVEFNSTYGQSSLCGFMLKGSEISALWLFLNNRVEISIRAQFDMSLPCDLNMSFNPSWITSNCVKIVQNSVEIERIKM